MNANSSPLHDDLIRLLGPMDDHKAVEIMALGPTWEELEVVAAYLAGESDVMGEERLPLSGNAGRIHEIVTRDELYDEDRAR